MAGQSVLHTLIRFARFEDQVDAAVAGLRVSEHEERVGLDLTAHRESGYTLVD